MENLSGKQASEQGQQASGQSTHARPPPTAEQLAQFAASDHRTGKKREASDAFATEYENPVRRTEAPQSTGIHNQRFVATTLIDQSHPVPPTLSASVAMENLSGEQISEQGQQATAESTNIRSPPTVEQLAVFAASHRQTGQKSEASEAFATNYEAPVRHTEAPQSIGVHNQRFVGVTPIDQSHLGLPSLSANNHDHISPATSALGNNADMHKQLRKKIQKEVELLYDSRLAKSNADLEALWRAKREERTMQVENYWRQKLTEVLSKGRDETTRELHEEVEKLKARLGKGPGLIKAAEERGRRQGELDGFNKLSLNPELKQSQDRVNFDFLMKEKDKEIAEVKATRDDWFKDAQKFSEDTNSKLREQDQQIQRLQALAQSPPPQPPSAPHNAETLIVAGQELQARFDNQTHELVHLQEKCNQQVVDFANLTARLDHIAQESSNRNQQLDAQSAELSKLLEALDKQAKDLSILRRESDRKSVDLNDSSKELEKRAKEINMLQEEGRKDSKELGKNRQQLKAQSEEIASLETRCNESESSNRDKDRKIAILQELLDSSSPQQSNSSDQEEIKLLKNQLAENESLLNEARSENASLRENQASSELEDLQATSEMDNAAPTEADTELVRAMLEKEREKIEAENAGRENRVNETLIRLEEMEEERRQMLKDELDRKEAELYDAQKRISDLEQRLFASSLSESSQPPLQAPPTPAHALPLILSPSPTPTPQVTGPSPLRQRSRFLGPRCLLVIILIFLLTFFARILRSLATSGGNTSLLD